MDPQLDLNDDLLSSYIDGELDAATRLRVDALLATDAGARQRLERMRHADQLLRAAFPLPASDRPDPLAARILGAREPRPPRAHRAWYRRPATLTALAASVGALAVAAVLRLAGSGDAVVDASLLAVLNQLPSGTELRSGDRRIQPLLSFRADDGRWCRVFGEQVAGRSEEGLACRDGDGWQLLARDDDGGGDAGSLRPAGAGQTVDARMAQLGDAPVLDGSQERLLIKQGWHGALP